MAPKQTVKVKQPPEKEIVTEVLAAAIVEIAAATRKFLSGRLRQGAIEILIQHHNTSPQVSRREIRAVLDSIASLENTYVRPKP